MRSGVTVSHFLRRGVGARRWACRAIRTKSGCATRKLANQSMIMSTMKQCETGSQQVMAPMSIRKSRLKIEPTMSASAVKKGGQAIPGIDEEKLELTCIKETRSTQMNLTTATSALESDAASGGFRPAGGGGGATGFSGTTSLPMASASLPKKASNSSTSIEPLPSASIASKYASISASVGGGSTPSRGMALRNSFRSCEAAAR